MVETLCPGVEKTVLPGGLACLKIKTPLLEALVTLQGAQVLEFKAQGQEPLLWVSPKAFFIPGKAIRGGVPVCWPWFGPSRTDAKLPQHGFARVQPWAMLSASSDADGQVGLSLGLEDSPETRRVWPFKFQLRLDLVFGSGLSVTLTAKNTDSQPWPWQAAFHPYLKVENLPACRLRGLQGLQFRNNPLPDLQPQNEEFLVLDHAVDRVYFQSPDQAQLQDGSGRTLMTFAKQGGSATVVWTPGPSPAKSPEDLPMESWKDFVCVEALTAFEQPLLPPGASAFLNMKLGR
jgi:glucose-6-phosphate 1-epimerase